jgi:hypothetical protein
MGAQGTYQPKTARSGPGRMESFEMSFEASSCEDGAPRRGPPVIPRRNMNSIGILHTNVNARDVMAARPTCRRGIQRRVRRGLARQWSGRHIGRHRPRAGRRCRKLASAADRDLRLPGLCDSDGAAGGGRSCGRARHAWRRRRGQSKFRRRTRGAGRRRRRRGAPRRHAGRTSAADADRTAPRACACTPAQRACTPAQRACTPAQRGGSEQVCMQRGRLPSY